MALVNLEVALVETKHSLGSTNKDRRTNEPRFMLSTHYTQLRLKMLHKHIEIERIYELINFFLARFEKVTF